MRQKSRTLQETTQRHAANRLSDTKMKSVLDNKINNKICLQ